MADSSEDCLPPQVPLKLPPRLVVDAERLEGRRERLLLRSCWLPFASVCVVGWTSARDTRDSSIHCPWLSDSHTPTCGLPSPITAILPLCDTCRWDPWVAQRCGPHLETCLQHIAAPRNMFATPSNTLRHNRALRHACNTPECCLAAYTSTHRRSQLRRKTSNAPNSRASKERPSCVSTSSGLSLN